jgi:hypothetical protein
VLNKLSEDNFIGLFCGDCGVFVVVGLFLVFLWSGKSLLGNYPAFHEKAE